MTNIFRVLLEYRGLLRILEVSVLSVNKMFIQHPQFFLTVLKCPKIAGANSQFYKIAGAIALIAPVLNRLFFSNNLNGLI